MGVDWVGGEVEMIKEDFGRGKPKSKYIVWEIFLFSKGNQDRFSPIASMVFSLQQ